MDDGALALHEEELPSPRSLPRRRVAPPRRRGSRRRPRRPRSPIPRSRFPFVRSARTPTRAPPPCLEIELDGDRLLPDRTVRADGEHDLRVHLEVGSRRHAQPLGWPAQIAELDPVLPRELGQLRILRDELVKPLSTSRPWRSSSSRARATREESARPASRLRPRRPWARREGFFDGADDRDSVVRLPRPGRVEDRDHRVRPVADDAAHRLAVVRVVREALAEDEESSRPRAHDCETPTRRGRAPSEESCTPSTSSTPGHGSSRRSRFPSRSTWSQSGARQQPAAMPVPTRACTRASRRDRAPEPRAPSVAPRGCRRTSRA